MSIKEIIKNKVYENFAEGTGLSFKEIFFLLFITCCVGGYIFLIYKLFSRTAFYSKDLNITLAGMTVVVSAIMIAMQSNLLVSLGMVGALSIVRFRTAIKNPIDLLYLFWTISAGIICGVRLYWLAVTLCIIMTFLIYGLNKIPGFKSPAIIVIRTDREADISAIFHILKDNSQYVRENSLMMKNGENEVIYEINAPHPSHLLTILSEQKGVLSVNWLQHNGELRA